MKVGFEMDDIEGLKLEDKIKLEEYRSLLEEHRDNRLYLFERPIIILGIIVAAMAASLRSYGSNISSELCLDIGLFVSLGLIILLCFNLRFTANRLERDARIVAYMQLVHEGNGTFKDRWYGWGNSLRAYHEMRRTEPKSKKNMGESNWSLKKHYYILVGFLSLFASSTFVIALTNSNAISELFINKNICDFYCSRFAVSLFFLFVAGVSLLNYFIVNRIEHNPKIKTTLQTVIFLSLVVTLLIDFGHKDISKMLPIFYKLYSNQDFFSSGAIGALQTVNSLLSLDNIIFICIMFLVISALVVLYVSKIHHEDRHLIWRLHSFLILIIYVSFIIALWGSNSIPKSPIHKLALVIILVVSILVIIYFFIVSPENHVDHNVVYRSYRSIWKLHLVLILIITGGSIVSLMDSINTTQINITTYTIVELGLVLTAAIISMISFFIPLHPEKFEGLIEGERIHWENALNYLQSISEEILQPENNEILRSKNKTVYDNALQAVVEIDEVNNRYI